MNKPGLFLLSVLTVLVQCRPPRQLIEGQKTKALISTEVKETGIWKALGPFGAPESLAKTDAPSAHGSGKFLCVNIHPDNPSEILAGHASSGLYKTVDNGKTWTQKLKFPFATGISHITRFPNDVKHLIASSSIEDIYANQYGYGLFESFDNGETWQRNGLQFEPEKSRLEFCRDVVITDKKRGKRIICISNFRIYTSIDGAKTWNASSTQSFDLVSIIVNPYNDKLIFICGNGGVLYSKDGGINWEDQTDEICNYSGQRNNGTGRFRISFSKQHKNRFYVLSESPNLTLAYASTDSIKNGKLIKVQGLETEQPYLVLGISKGINGAENIYAGTKNLYGRTDTSSLFHQLTSQALNGSNHAHHGIQSITFHADHIYLTTNGGIDVSKDGGMTWTSLTDDAELNTSMIFGFDQSRKGILMCGTEDNGLLTLKNGKWYCSGLAGSGGKVVAINDSTGFATAFKDAGYTTKDAGISFSYQYAGKEIPGVRICMNYHQRSRTYYLANDHLYKKKEGKYFEIISSKLSTDQPIKAFVVNPANENEIWLCKDGTTDNDQLTGIFFYTQDGGLNWADRTYRLPILKQHSISAMAKGHGNQVMAALQAFDTIGKEQHKIYISDHSGLQFINISKGLPNVPVNTIIYVKNRWICGNHQGVYQLRDNKWEVLGAGFPPVIVTELRYNEDQGTLMASTFGKGIWVIKL